MPEARVKVSDIIALKGKRKITMLTAYDYPLASLIDASGVDIILVGDSLANVALGLESTKDVGMAEMLHHAKAVSRAVKHALVIGDMPFVALHKKSNEAALDALRFIKEAGCLAVKSEWFSGCIEVAEKIIASGVALMGHIGLTPQTADKLGGLKVQGKDAQAASELINQAKALEKCGCFAMVLECIPDKIAQIITRELKIPTIGIGAGVHCDGQVLVTHDMLGLFDRYRPKFVKKYGDASILIRQAIEEYKREVIEGKFPDKEHSFAMSQEELQKLKIKL